MSMMRIASAAALLSLVGAAPARASEPLQPTGKWNVDFGDAHCTATRTYGSTDKPITLAIKVAPIGDVVQMSVVRSARNSEIDQYPGTLRVDGSKPVAVSYVGHPGGAGKLRVTSAKLTPALFAPVRSASSVRLLASGELDESFALASIGQVMTVLDRCVADLRQVWHVGEHSATLRQQAVTLQSLPQLFSTDDYPAVALRGDNTGLVGVILLVNESGRVAACEVSLTSGHASLDAQTCMILTRRARFAPAIGPDGKPAKSAAIARIRWTM